MTNEYVNNYFEEMKGIIDKFPKEDVENVINALFTAWKNGSRIYLMGNGGSASTATHFMCDLAKCTIVEGKKRFKVSCLVDNIPLVSALTNDEGFGQIFVEQLKHDFQKGDVAIAFSVHGGSGEDKAGPWSQNLVKALEYAKEKGGVTIGFAGYDGGAFKDICDYTVIVPAESTPHVESFHVILEHMICNAIKEKIEKEG